ncbi:MAG: Franean1_4349 family RiPP [Ardenticatenales bacterium]|nr:Franean1_4349 family RiPP [Ardenticatenales bacterium]
MSDFQTIVGRAVSDKDFAQKLVDNPEEALREAGVEPTAEMVDALKGLDVDSIQNLASAFGEDKAAI